MAEYAAAYKNSKFGRKNETFMEQQMVDRIASGELFGFVQYDISVPDNLDHVFKEMCSMFKNKRLDRDDLSKHMRDYVAETGRLKQPQSTLIGS